MERVINAIGFAIIASKYAAVLLLAGISISTGAVATEAMLFAGIDSGE